MKENENIKNALQILETLGLPRQQRNERSALCLLGLLNLTPEKTWVQAQNPLVGITPMMEFSRKHYAKGYAPNTRETFRRQTIHQFVQAGIALYNPDRPERPVNSPKAVYQVSPETLTLLKTFGTKRWKASLKHYLSTNKTLSQIYAKERKQKLTPVTIAPGQEINISPGEHSELIKGIIENFAPRFAPGAVLVYVGDTGEKWGYFDEELLVRLGGKVDSHGKMPDVVFYYPEKDWLLLVESVTSHAPVDAKRHAELSRLFAGTKAGLLYVTAFPSRSVMTRYLGKIAWETEVWVADSPSHLIHFNGPRFLGPYGNKPSKR
ncbi:MAG: BsuBI/PstI family type II restriction endonuclease [Desulfobaccales bacterium]